MNLKYIQQRIISFILPTLIAIFTFACNNGIPCNNNNHIPTNSKLSTTPSVTPFPLSSNEPVLNSDEKTDRKFHEDLYQRKLKILSVIGELTNLNKKYINKLLSDDEHEKRKKIIFNLVDSLNENTTDTIKNLDNTDGLITLAKMCRIMEIHGGYGLSKATSAYDIAFFYSVKIIALKHKNDPTIMNELKQLKRYNIDGPYGGDFRLALNGQDPKYLYGEEPEFIPEEP